MNHLEAQRPKKRLSLLASCEKSRRKGEVILENTNQALQSL